MNEIQAIAVKPKQGGYTLVELAIAVAILAVLIVAGLSGVQSILTSGKVNDQIKTVAKLSSKVSGSFNGTSSGTSGMTTSSLANLSFWDSSKVNAGAVTSSFGTSEFAKSNANVVTDMAKNTGLVYAIAKVPSAACSDLAVGLSNIVYGIRIQKASITSETDTYPDASATVIEVKSAGGAIDPVKLGNGCGLGTQLDFFIALKP